MEMAEREGQEEAVREKKEEEKQKTPKNGDGGKEEEDGEHDEEEDLLPESFGQRQAKDKQTRPAAEKVFVDIDELAKSDFKPENCENRNLVVIDLNGFLMQRSFSPLGASSSGFRIEQDAKVGNFFVYNRPHMKEFLDFLHENFTVGVWSSATEYNARMLVRHLWGKKKEKQLAFVWGQEVH